MQVNDALQVVVPVRENSTCPSVFAYHVPISREVFEANYRIIAATKAQLASKGIYYQMDSGPRIAAMALRDEGKRDAEARGDFDEGGKPRDQAAPLLAEIKRLTTLLVPASDGWDMLPVDAAISQDKIDADEWQEALSALVFFTCHYALAKKHQRIEMANAMSSILSASITSSSLSEYASLLPKSTPGAVSPAKAA